jgi:hypothetical protein
MTKKETKLYHSYKDFKQYYPHRDLKLASNIIKILALSPELSSKEIGFKLSSMEGGHTPPSIRVTLEKLVDAGYVIKKSEKHKSQTNNLWTISCVGNLVSLIIFKDDEFYSFINQHKEERFYKMIHVLIENSKKDLVKLLIDRLNEINNDQLKIETIAKNWYNDMRVKISKMDTSRYPELEKLQGKIKRDGFKPINLTNRGFIIDPIFSDTLIDRICD